MDETKQASSNKGFQTPLGIVALFISLTEVVAGTVATQTSHGVQIALVGFIIGFPILVAATFFAFLWFRPQNLYHPAEVNAQGFGDWAKVIDRKPLEDDRQYEKIKAAVTNTNISTAEAYAVTEAIRKAGFVTVDSQPLLGTNGREWQERYDVTRTVQSLLNAIYGVLSAADPNIHGSSYAKQWFLRDKETKTVFQRLGNASGRRVGGFPTDDRTLEDVGIKPGMVLEVIPPSPIVPVLF